MQKLEGGTKALTRE